MKRIPFLCLTFIFLLSAAAAQIPSPKDVLGFTPGDDRKLASWAQIVEYFQKLDAASDRVMFEEIGKSTMGAPFVYATISSPENLTNLKKYKEINDKLADPRKIKSSSVQGRLLAAQGKTIVLITCGIHSTEVGSTLSSMLIAYQLALAPHPDVKKILDNTIILLVPSLNPDGVDIVKNWYDKTLGTPYEGTDPPELYHKYVGHDNNRDWYAFTQVETQLTVDKIHNVWHPQIVHDIHQQGALGSRLFLPPYKAPVEPNVPKQIVEGYTELGNYMASSLRGLGYQGITTNSTYDAWTPARAYSHYHGGVRILSETASARIASPVNIKFEDLRASPDSGYDPKVESANFGPVWRGGEWNLRKITDHMTTAAFALMFHAADNREKWLSRFYEIGKEAVRPRRDGELSGFVVGDKWGVMLNLLTRGGVEVKESVVPDFRTNGIGVFTIPMAQPYSYFAKALVETQEYPDLKDPLGQPIAPYDVTAHTLPLLFGTKVVPQFAGKKSTTLEIVPAAPQGCAEADSRNLTSFYIFRSDAPSMDEGWTRYLVDTSANWRFTKLCGRIQSGSVDSQAIRSNRLSFRGIIFPDQPPAQILNGYAKGTMPDEYTGGVGKEGVENLKKFVEAGGTLVFLNRSTEFAIEQFNLPIRNVVKGLSRKDFFIPGSILRTELRSDHPITKGLPRESIAWFENSPAFDYVLHRDKPSLVVADGGARSESSGFDNMQVRFIATYPADSSKILLSGWALGAGQIAGKAALVEIKAGKGKIILFGFRPQYRGQSLATFPLLFNAISQ